MHGLHTQNLIVTLFVVEHRRGEIIEDVVCVERSIGLSERVSKEGLKMRIGNEPVSIHAK